MKINFKKKVLENGFTILYEKRNIPVVSVSIAVRSGGINERLDEKGISHFIEHMLYKGTKKRSAKKIAEEIEKNGGELNGFTAESITCFWCKMPSIHLKVALDVLTDLVKNPKFDDVEIEKERKVIFEEIKMRRDSPRHYVYDKIQSLLYTGTLGTDLIGNQKTMNSIGKAELLKRFKEVYVPENMILTVVGDAEFDTIVSWAKKHFSSKRKKKVFNASFNLKNEVVTEERKGIDQANLVLAYHSPLANDDLIHAEHVLITLLAGGLSSRLFSEIREKRNLAYTIHGDIDSDSKYSHSVIFVGTKKKNIEKVKALILKEYEKIAKSLTEKELKQIKEQLIGNYQISMEDSQSQMAHLLSEEIDSDARDFYKFVEKISKVKLKDVKKLASRVKEGNYSFFALVPED